MKTIILSLVFIINYSIMTAQQAQKVNLEELGLSFEIPAGWSGQMEAEYILLGHQTLPGFMVLVENDAKSLEELKSKAKEGLNEDGISLQLSKEVTTMGNARADGHYKGIYQGKNVKAYAIGLLNTYGNGMTVLTVTEADQFTKTHIAETQKLAQSVRFSVPVENEWVTFWKNRLGGKRFKHLNSSSDEDYIGGTTTSSETVIVNFCANGNFRYYYNQMNTMDTVDASAHQALRDNNTGTYEIYSQNGETWVDLNFNSGRVNTFELTTDNAKQKTLFNGVRYYNTGEQASCE